MKLEVLIVVIASLAIVRAASDTYTDSEARKILSGAGITVNHPKPQTSLEGIKKNTINMLLTLKSASKCDIVVTGGTEPGHSTSGTKNHGTGYKLDIRPLDCISRYITSTFPKCGIRSDKAQMYCSKSGSVYAYEDAHKDRIHWDILYP